MRKYEIHIAFVIVYTVLSVTTLSVDMQWLTGYKVVSR